MSILHTRTCRARRLSRTQLGGRSKSLPAPPTRQVRPAERASGRAGAHADRRALRKRRPSASSPKQPEAVQSSPKQPEAVQRRAETQRQVQQQVALHYDNSIKITCLIRAIVLCRSRAAKSSSLVACCLLLVSWLGFALLCLLGFFARLVGIEVGTHFAAGRTANCKPRSCSRVVALRANQSSALIWGSLWLRLAGLTLHCLALL